MLQQQTGLSPTRGPQLQPGVLNNHAESLMEGPQMIIALKDTNDYFPNLQPNNE